MNTAQYPIPIVINNQEKGVSYTANFQRYKKARKAEFYLECLWILYAMLEDRTSALLYYIGFTSNAKRSSVTGSKKIKAQIRSILNMTVSNEKYRFDSISGKMDRIQQLFKWSSSYRNEDTPYKKVIAKILEPLSQQQELNDALAYLNDEWRDKRNQLTHALFIKKADAVVNELQPLVDEGYRAIRAIDAAVREVKRHNIRKQFKIQ